jgi:uncharacterized protein YcbK (DUF882 family)
MPIPRNDGWNKEMYPDFEPSEFLCKCSSRCTHKDFKLLDSNVLTFIQEIRDEVGLPIYITSALRCPEHNEKVHGAKNSRHVLGKACDFSFQAIDTIEFSIKLVWKFNWKGGIGAYPDNKFIHVDSDNQRSTHTGGPRHWVYENGKYDYCEFYDIEVDNKQLQ